MREGLGKIALSEDTIVAIATPFGRSGIGVVRISGSRARSVGRQFFRGSPLLHRSATVGVWFDADGSAIDTVVATLFEKPHSFTGEDVLEISAHGNPMILERIVASLLMPGVRPAVPGEFTWRAVTHGKMDLVQAEAVRDFVDAQTTTQARMARQQMDGSVSKRILPVKSGLVDVIAHLEAAVDFSDDELEQPDTEGIVKRVRVLRESLEELQNTYAYGRLVRSGVRVVICGKPNVGKSTLFNRLIEADRAIVTDLPGTTRDVLSEVSVLDGVPIVFLDTAGIRETTDRVERLGVERTLESIGDADLALFVVDGSAPWSTEDRDVLERLSGIPCLAVVNKSDLDAAVGIPADLGMPQVRVSARTGSGVESVRHALKSRLSLPDGEPSADSVLSTARQNESVLRAIRALRQFEDAAGGGTPPEIAVLDLYEALSALNDLTGETVTDDILARIFSTFCIGK